MNPLLISLASLFTWSLAWSLASLPALAKPFTAEAFALGGDLKTPLFKLERSEEGSPARLTTQAKFTDPTGKPVVLEDAIIENGAITYYRQDHLQLQENGTVTVKEGKIYFVYTRDGKTERAEEKAVDNLVASPNTLDFLRKHWAKIQAGETVPVRFLVPDRLETVGFKFFKTGAQEKDGKKRILIRMKASSIVIAALVDPVEFVLEPRGENDFELLEVKGRTIPKLWVNNRWKDLDAHIFYHFHPHSNPKSK
jgi:hypothetical protein